MKITEAQIAVFQQFIWNFYRDNGRVFAWRNVDDPYKVVVSEIMLQQTQTHRVEPKYDQFIQVFPNFDILARASLKEVLAVWQGLGYNRRGQYLHQLAAIVMERHGGVVPADVEILKTFPGIGAATAASICAFAFNSPVPFIETNIRAVFIHSFFSDRQTVHDKELLPLVIASMDHANSREWYYALMDYGVMLKKKYRNPSRRSAHHIKQSAFEGSDRQIRGAIIARLTSEDKILLSDLVIQLNKEHERVTTIINQLLVEKLIKSDNEYLYIP